MAYYICWSFGLLTPPSAHHHLPLGVALCSLRSRPVPCPLGFPPGGLSPSPPSPSVPRPALCPPSSRRGRGRTENSLSPTLHFLRISIGFLVLKNSVRPLKFLFLLKLRHLHGYHVRGRDLEKNLKICHWGRERSPQNYDPLWIILMCTFAQTPYPSGPRGLVV